MGIILTSLAVSVVVSYVFEFIRGSHAAAAPPVAPATPNPPVGSAILYSGQTSPVGWLLCDGRDISGVPGCAALAAHLQHEGKPHNVRGDGPSVVRIPDYRNRLLRGANGAAPPGAITGTNHVPITSANVPVLSGTTYQSAPPFVNVASGSGCTAMAGMPGNTTAYSYATVINPGSPNTPLTIDPECMRTNYIIKL